jgi:hypothetical protein
MEISLFSGIVWSKGFPGTEIKVTMHSAIETGAIGFALPGKRPSQLTMRANENLS